MIIIAAQKKNKQFCSLFEYIFFKKYVTLNRNCMELMKNRKQGAEKS